ncbi:MAG: hypothetical protein LIO65_05275 [Odoribacter sp.]|nr:hypothetical protein [Odoribacter sp.]
MKKYLVGFAAFMIVLFAMPLGHAAMIIMEKTLPGNQLFIGALLLGAVGIALTVWGCYMKKDGTATFLGLVGALFVWTGWVEFCYVYYANRYGVPPLMENGEIVTKLEYLIMPSSVGLWTVVMMLYIFGKRTNCSFLLLSKNFLEYIVIRQK